MSKGGLLAIEIGPKKKSAPSSPEIDLEEDDAGEGPSDDEIDQAQSLLDAIAAKDAAGIVVAFKALDAACDASMKE